MSLGCLGEPIHSRLRPLFYPDFGHFRESNSGNSAMIGPVSRQNTHELFYPLSGTG